MRRKSNGIDTWGTICSVFGVVFVLVGFIAWTLDADFAPGLMAMGCGLIVLAPILKGFSILVKNAEDQIEARERTNDEHN